VTAAIHDLHRLADRLGDLASIPFLLDFISEQTEEEVMVGAIIDRLALATGSQALCSSSIMSSGPGKETRRPEPGPIGQSRPAINAARRSRPSSAVAPPRRIARAPAPESGIRQS